MKKRIVDLPRGGTLEIEFTPVFLERVRKQFQLESNESITDDHIRMFVWSSVNSAVLREENEGRTC